MAVDIVMPQMGESIFRRHNHQVAEEAGRQGGSATSRSFEISTDKSGRGNSLTVGLAC